MRTFTSNDFLVKRNIMTGYLQSMSDLRSKTHSAFNCRYVPPLIPQGRPMSIAIGYDNFEILKVPSKCYRHKEASAKIVI